MEEEEVRTRRRARGRRNLRRKCSRAIRSTEEENLPEVDVIAEMLDRGSRAGVGGWSAEMMEAMVGMEDVQMENMLRMIRSSFAEEVGGDPEM